MDSRDVLATVDKLLTVVLEPIGDGKIRVGTSSWELIAGVSGLRADRIGRGRLRAVELPRYTVAGGGVTS
jgi:hypothetical protein